MFRMRRKTRALALALAVCLVLAAVVSHGIIARWRLAAAHAREVTLRNNLHTFRKVIDQYAAEKGALPKSVDQLVNAGYLREIPVDPFTGQRNWVVVMGVDPQTGATGVVDLRSSSLATSYDGTPYSQW